MPRVRVPEGVPKSGPLVKWPKTPASHAGNMGSNPVRVTNLIVIGESQNDIDGVFGAEVPPVPIPNTVVKLSSADNTWLEAAREDRAMPSQHSSIAQLVEHAAVNRRVVGSSPTWGAKENHPRGWFSLAFRIDFKPAKG